MLQNEISGGGGWGEGQGETEMGGRGGERDGGWGEGSEHIHYKSFVSSE